MIKRCGRILSDYEEKLHLVSRFVSVKEKVNQIHILTKNCQNESKESLMRKIEEISNGILENYSRWHLKVYRKNCRMFSKN